MPSQDQPSRDHRRADTAGFRGLRWAHALVALLIVTGFGGSAVAQEIPPILAEPMQVGEHVDYRVETAHPYWVSVGEKTTTTYVIQQEGATYVALHFERFELAPGDYVIVRSPDGSREWRYEGFGKPGVARGEGFWSIHVAGERIIVDLVAENGGAYGFSIDKVARGFAPIYDTEAICGADDSDWAQCYTASEAAAYEEGRGVARLLINGSGLCTGWLVGSEGHLMTNNHCISTQNAAGNTNYEFMAEGMCGENCPQLQCDGTIVTTSGTLIQTSGTLDYTLIQLDVNPTATYGYLQLNEAGATIGDRLYIPQHPGGQGKRIALFSTDSHDPDGWPIVDNRFFSGARELATYFADTSGGSSGSPVVGYDDNCVIVLHSGTFGCSGLGNTGTTIDQIIGDLGANLPADALCSDSDIFTDGFESGDVSVWSSNTP